jgi:polysaccharide pyruvyl transferase WcaK-like protein
VLVRDSVSRDVCTQLGRSADALTTDVVFALPVPTASVSRDVLLNVSGLLWSGGVHVDAAAYREVVREVYARLTAEGRRVSLLAHVLDSPGADNDVPAVHELAQTCSPAPEVIVPSSLDEARAAVASATVVVGSRMHACLNALSVGTPAVALAYSRKFAPLLTDLGWKHTVDLRHDPAPARNACAAVEAAQTSGDVAAVGARASERLQSARTVLAALATPVAMHR